MHNAFRSMILMRMRTLTLNQATKTMQIILGQETRIRIFHLPLWLGACLGGSTATMPPSSARSVTHTRTSPTRSTRFSCVQCDSVPETNASALSAPDTRTLRVLLLYAGALLSTKYSTPNEMAFLCQVERCHSHPLGNKALVQS